MNPKYSIIIPHKNIPHLLLRCLNSIPLHKEIQVIVVDDKSDSNIILQLQKMQKIYSSICFIYTREGYGAGYARNIGMDRATGKWLLFADADDFFDANFVSIIDKHFNDDDDIIYFVSRSVDSNTLLPVKSRADISKCVLSNNIKK